MADKRAIDLNQYARRDIFKAFNDRLLPHFSTTCEVDVTGIKRGADQTGESFFIALSYAVARAVNAVPEFRHRVIDGVLFEYERVHPGYTVARENDLFSFCDSVYDDNFARYSEQARLRIDAVKSEPDLALGDKNAMFFITSIPWFRFTSFTHPYDPMYGYIPVITLGQYADEGGRVTMPVAVQVHHGVVDGLHVGRFYAELTRLAQTDVADEWLRH
ncbi:MAG TPA: chloramphenicol acetyltransferase [Aquabacterium sp.]|nr:chloramphenicol acetyltransferase [Aquabacterium sp.]